MKLDQILGEYFCLQNMININGYYKIEEVNAKNLLVPERIDLVAKLKYIECREKGQNLSFIKTLYTAHIEAFSNGSYTEPGNDRKNSINKYFNTFNNLIDNIKQSGIDHKISVVPVGRNNVILDGAHRVAIAAYFDLKVPIIRFENLYADYGVEFFQKRLLRKEYIDYLVKEYCKYNNNLYFACIYPEFKEDMKMKNLDVSIKTIGKVFYNKKIKITYEAFKNLITQINSNLEGIEEYDDGKNFLNIYLLECNNLRKFIDLKVNIGEVSIKHFIYLTNNQTETIELANILLGKDTIDLFYGQKTNHFFELQSCAQRKARNIKYNSKRKLIILSKKMGLYKDLRLFYHFLRDIVK